MTKNTKLLVDKDCPLCHWYSNKFVKTGRLKPNNIAYYQTIESEVTRYVDMDRAKAEIAYCDIENQTTLYGIDAIISLVTQGHPLLKRILSQKPFYNFLKLLYAFISHNRKVIYPTRIAINERSCTPSINKKLRWVYILIIACISATVINAFSRPLLALVDIQSNLSTALMICFGLVVWQSTITKFFCKESFLDYLGNMSTVSILGSLLLLPIILVANLVHFNIWFYIVYFGIVVSFMFFEHARRCSILESPFWLNLSWISYGVLVFFLILIIIITKII